MKSLEQYNRERRAAIESAAERNKKRHRTPMGVACPKCGAELRVDLTILLTSNPAQRNVHCESCDYHGHVIA